jgi:hypothetical protein
MLSINLEDQIFMVKHHPTDISSSKRRLTNYMMSLYEVSELIQALLGM